MVYESGYILPSTGSGSGPHIATISARAFFYLARKADHPGFLLTPKDDGKYFCSSTTNAVTTDDYNIFMKGKPTYSWEELLARVPRKYHSEIKVFLKKNADKLPPHRAEDHKIQLMEGTTAPFARNYRPMSEQELEAVKKYLEEHLGKGFIRPSSSSAAAPVLLVRKPGGGLRVCVDYRALNAITIKNRYPIPQMRETLNRLCKAKIFSKFDVVAAFNRLRIQEGQEWLTAFNTRYGQYEYLVMPFGLCNAPGTFQSYINNSVREYLDVFCTAYLDDILVFSDNEEEHTEQVLKVLQRLRERGLQLDIDKCEFDVKEVKYLGLIISTDGVKMDPEKLEAIENWETPRSAADIQAFLGFANFYRRFIANFSALTRPLNDRTKGEAFTTRSGKKKMRYVPFTWTPECQQAFDGIKEAFRSAPMLAHFDPEKETWVETDASDFVTAGVLSQMHNGVLRPVAFFSKKMSPAECNYMIYDKELLAIIRSFELWKPEVASLAPENPVQVFTDHKNLEYFMTTKQLNRRQARWAEFLSEFNFKIMYRPGKQGEKPDILTRRSQDLPKGFSDDRQRHQFQTLLQAEHLDEDVKKALSVMFCADELDDRDEDDDQSVLSDMPSEDLEQLGRELNEETPSGQPETEPRDMEALLEAAYSSDQLVQDIMEAKRIGARRIPPHVMAAGIKLSMGDLEVRDRRLWFANRLYVPEDHELRRTIMEAHHIIRTAGHPGPKAMYRNLLRGYYWPGMKQDCKQYADNCSSCHRAKSRTILKQGLLKSLPIPQRKWVDLSMDFIVDLPPCYRNGRTYRHGMIVVDRLTKGCIFEPLTSLETDEIYEAMNRRVFCTRGLPDSMVSDRGSQLISHLWRRICQRKGVRLKYSSAHHPETDGQTEIINKLIKTYLRNYINWTQDDWVDFFPEAEFAQNNKDHSATGISPFFADFGYHPRSGAEPPTTYEGRPHPDVEAADKILARRQQIEEYLQDQIAWAQEDYEKHANKHRSPHPEYRVGDLVYVNAKHFAAERPSRSLGMKNAGPWEIIRVINNKAYEVKLPEHLERAGLTPIFHPSKLHLAPTNPYPGQYQDPQPPILITTGDADDDGHEEWEIDEILDCRATKRFGVQYKATYRGHWDQWNAAPPWQPWTDFKLAAERIKDFHAAHPDKPRAPSYFDAVPTARETSP
jgi:transposase InsO family protein